MPEASRCETTNSHRFTCSPRSPGSPRSVLFVFVRLKTKVNQRPIQTISTRIPLQNEKNRILVATLPSQIPTVILQGGSSVVDKTNIV